MNSMQNSIYASQLDVWKKSPHHARNFHSSPDAFKLNLRKLAF